jgi:uncharacterized protein (TIGR02099 family)
MTEPAPSPSRLLKFAAGCARWALGLMLAFWLLLALAWGGLHGWIVPRIGQYQAPLQRYAERALGVPVRIGALTARSEGVFPTVELSNVALLDAQGHEALRLPRVVLALSPRSLLRLGFEQIYMESPELDVRRDGAGRIFIAGLHVPGGAQPDGAAADWLFAQTEVIVHNGTLRWNDELRGAEPLALTQVDLLLHGGGWSHGVRLDATPPPEWGARFTLMGQFREPLLAAHGATWQQWSGQLFANFSRVDVSRLQRYADLGALRVSQGRGALRAWMDVQRGAAVGGAADVQLAEVSATLGKDLQPLALRSVAGRLGGQRLADGFEFSTRGLQFVTDDGLQWPGGNVLLRHTGLGHPGQEQGELRADRLDLAALAEIASRLPLDEAARGALADYAPRGLVREVTANWRGPLTHPAQYQVHARVDALALADAPPGAAPSRLGLRGASVQLDLTQAGGQAALSVADGALLLPGVFEEPVVPMRRLDATVRWQIDGARIAVQTDDLRFANADAEGEARLDWHTAAGPARFPGVLDLSGTLSRADDARVHRYLPLGIPAESRHYVRDAILSGSASQARFRIKGNLNDLPFGHGEPGEFHIEANVKDVTFAYAPPSVSRAGEQPWPALANLSGELVFDRAGMAVRNASGAVQGWPRLQVQAVNASIADLEHTAVDVSGNIRGPLPDMLALVHASPIARLTHGALEQASATGATQVQLGLHLPIDAMDTSTVRGSLALTGNDVRFTPDAPTLAGARGAVQFTESGFTLAGVQGRALGGDVQLSGGMGAPQGASGDSALRLRAQGTATAEGLRAQAQLGLIARLARHASGSAAYTLTLGMRRDVPELQISTDLRGMALDVPAPLGKTAQQALPVRLQTRLTPEAAASASAPLRDMLTLELGDVGSLAYLRAPGAQHAQVLAGAIIVGQAAQAADSLPAQGVVANLTLDALDTDAWRALLQTAPGAGGADDDAGAPQPDYLPTRVALRTAALTVQGRTLRNVVAGASREGATWRANVNAEALSGYLEYHPEGDGAPQSRLYARLSRLAVPRAADSQVDALLDAGQSSAQLPALDIEADDFVLHGWHLGRLGIQADNQAAEDGTRQWRLQQFNLLTPEATLTSSGQWALLGHAGADARKRTTMNFRLDIHDFGKLLARFGMAGVLRNGQGRIEGQIGWLGSPLSPDYPTMTGQMNVNMQTGQFLKTDPGPAKLLNVLSLQALPRRLTLDFRDVFSAGFAFDFVRGDVHIEQGVATTNNLQMKGVNAAVLMEGSADIGHETQNLHVVVVPEINAMTASLVATAINPVVGLGSFLAQVFLRGPLAQAATREFHIDGPWAEPRVERIERHKPANGAGAPSPFGGEHP